MVNLPFYIWIRRPNRMSINIISPDGEKSNIISSKRKNREEIKFVLSNTIMRLYNFLPEHFTGHQAIIGFRNLVPGIWKIQLSGDYIVDGRYDIWLPPKEVLPEGTVFLEPDPNITLTIPSTARKVVTVAYYNNERNVGISESGKGFNSNGLINPDVITAGVNILTTKPLGGVSTFSGSSAATAICAGVCCLLLQWGIVEKNNLVMYSTTVKSYLMYGAQRRKEFTYPNREVGYGVIDIVGTFKFIAGLYQDLNRNVVKENSDYSEYWIGDIFVRIPRELED
ncbi:S8 family serine peptidase [Clostridium tertium]|uniref:S8 family serine peptidase n=1 Tax=Clostridium tertium TaxID=1559 RepID=UPI0024B34F4A|nr:S8 family serine peptidase [Clostridium tertium]MDI9215413.1 S8 family serine peptidase [Clostridium tertium]